MPETNENPWRSLRLASVVFAVTALAGGGAAYAAWWHEHGATEGMKGAEERLAEARRRYSAFADETGERRRYALAFREWTSNGRIGEGQPESWARAVRSASSEVLSASHRTSASRVVGQDGGVEILATDMSLELRMRHEAELPEFLAVLARETRGLFTVSGCRLLRSRDEWSGAPLPAPIDASCRLQWRTVRLAAVASDWSPPLDEDVGSDDRVPLPGAAARERYASPPEALGRLFTTAEERARIEEEHARIESAATARAPEAPPAAEPERPPARTSSPPRPPKWVHVNGLVARSGRPVFTWIDGTRVDHRDGSARRAEPAGATPSGVRLEAGGRWISVRAGQRFDPATGEIADRIRRPADRLDRAQSLQASSHAPLLDSSATGRN